MGYGSASMSGPNRAGMLMPRSVSRVTNRLLLADRSPGASPAPINPSAPFAPRQGPTALDRRTRALYLALGRNVASGREGTMTEQEWLDCTVSLRMIEF